MADPQRRGLEGRPLPGSQLSALLSNNDWLGIGAIVGGLVVIAFCRQISEYALVRNRAEQRFATTIAPKRAKEVVRAWTSPGTGTDLGSRVLRILLILALGVAMILGGIAALAGVWGPS